jgi:hypothetical protein
MPQTPKGAKRPADVIANAVHVMRIATGEVEDLLRAKQRAGGLKSGRARARSLSAVERTAIAKKAAQKRWEGRRLR